MKDAQPRMVLTLAFLRPCVRFSLLWLRLSRFAVLCSK
jgi:hypothetical protein